ncbi:MAG: VWA domain-containing protein [Ktedonobacterales bacterium]|nr:VWA domain-containing protein [Ktedonobacterales bacterium]
MFKRWFFNREHTYSRWDGSQRIEGLDADEILDALADDYLRNNDLRGAMQRLQMNGMQGQDGQRMMGLREMLDRLRNQKQSRMGRYNMSGVMDDIREKLEAIKQHEREGIQRRLSETGQPQNPDDQGQQGNQPGDQEQPGEQGEAGLEGQQGQPGQSGQPSQRGQSGQGGQPQAGQGSLPEGIDPAALRKMLEQMAQKKQDFLDQLPRDPAGQIRELSDYDFMDAQAREEFQELLQMMQQQVMQQFFQGMQQSLQQMTPEDVARMREMIQALNQMLRDREAGREPDFDSFMEKYGDFFGPGINSLDDLIEDLQRRSAQMQAVMDSLPEDQRRELQEMMDQIIGDDRLRVDMAELAERLAMQPGGDFRTKYKFSGDEPVTLTEAMGLMGELQGLDELEAQMNAARRGGTLEGIDNERLRNLMGEEDAAALDDLKGMMRELEEAGLIQRNGNKWELTSQGIRKVGQKALQDMFAQLDKDAFGQHAAERRGAGGERTDETKPYVFGDPFLLDLQGTVMNAIERGERVTRPGTPTDLNAASSGVFAAPRTSLHLTPDDFEVYRTELITQASTVLMIDMSMSMFYSGASQAAKKMAVALESLIRGQFPRDNLYVVGFSMNAREYKREELVEISEVDHSQGTNTVQGLVLARHLLARHKGGNKQIILVTDGDPTVMWNKDEKDWVFAYHTYDPDAVSQMARMQTLVEAQRCTREGITINTFMLVRNPRLMDFVSELSQINRGRAFFTAPEDLGKYLLVDYLASKQVFRQG